MAATHNLKANVQSRNIVHIVTLFTQFICFSFVRQTRQSASLSGDFDPFCPAPQTFYLTALRYQHYSIYHNKQHVVCGHVDDLSVKLQQFQRISISEFCRYQYEAEVGLLFNRL